jgi:hypothetical protein
MVVEGGPDVVVVVDDDGVVDAADFRRGPYALDVVLEGELRRVDSDHHQAVVAVGLRPSPHIRRLAQPVDARERPHVHENDLAAQPGGIERLRVDPRRRPAE